MLRRTRGSGFKAFRKGRGRGHGKTSRVSTARTRTASCTAQVACDSRTAPFTKARSRPGCGTGLDGGRTMLRRIRRPWSTRASTSRIRLTGRGSCGSSGATAGASTQECSRRGSATGRAPSPAPPRNPRSGATPRRESHRVTTRRRMEIEGCLRLRGRMTRRMRESGLAESATAKASSSNRMGATMKETSSWTSRGGQARFETRMAISTRGGLWRGCDLASESTCRRMVKNTRGSF
mmetsp:Transcript_49878/g.118715  ORF Transcript_49878/g.118715 Transcript_49878/m.118715 type:complete len:236 (+) Transcript_49878:142-849(+)